MIINGYRAMWILVMFDLPTDTKKARRDYALFRKNLLKDGFWMLQYSVYARPCPSEENVEVHHGRVRRFLPPDGEVRILLFTDKQFARMQVFHGKMRKPPEEQPEQLEFFKPEPTQWSLIFVACRADSVTDQSPGANHNACAKAHGGGGRFLKTAFQGCEKQLF